MMGGGGMGGGAGGGMGNMMEQMGAPKPKELYPSLMALPDLLPERRRQVEEEGARADEDRCGPDVGRARSPLTGSPVRRLRRDAGSVRDASRGAVAVRQRPRGPPALAEGRAPRQVALEWFKKEMNLLPPGGGERPGGVFGLSWFHFTVMLILIAFAAAMIAMYFFKICAARPHCWQRSRKPPSPGIPPPPEVLPEEEPQRPLRPAPRSRGTRTNFQRALPA